MIVHKADGTRLKKDRLYGKTLKIGQAPDALVLYLDNGSRLRTELIPLFKEKLKKIEQWFETQHELRFYGSSILLIYEGDEDAPDPNKVDVRMIDFAHIWPMKDGGVEEGYLYGLRSFMDHLDYVDGGKIPKCYSGMVLHANSQLTRLELE